MEIFLSHIWFILGTFVSGVLFGIKFQDTIINSFRKANLLLKRK